jgi:hypothetical protein
MSESKISDADVEDSMKDLDDPTDAADAGRDGSTEAAVNQAIRVRSLSMQVLAG